MSSRFKIDRNDGIFSWFNYSSGFLSPTSMAVQRIIPIYRLLISQCFSFVLSPSVSKRHLEVESYYDY